MNPGPPPPSFHVDWDQLASDGLIDSFAAYFPSRQGVRVTRAEQIVEYLLGDDPERNGAPLAEGLFALTVSPLRVRYEIHPSSRLVRVTSVGFFPV